MAFFYLEHTNEYKIAHQVNETLYIGDIIYKLEDPIGPNSVVLDANDQPVFRIDWVEQVILVYVADVPADPNLEGEPDVNLDLGDGPWDEPSDDDPSDDEPPSPIGPYDPTAAPVSWVWGAAASDPDNQ